MRKKNLIHVLLWSKCINDKIEERKKTKSIPFTRRSTFVQSKQGDILEHLACEVVMCICPTIVPLKWIDKFEVVFFWLWNQI